MDNWRTFFKRAGADLWTVIEQAIILAATDYPKEFKEKRSDIAETLFARKLLQLIPGDTDVTRFSGSVVTNATNCPEANDERDDANGTKHTQSLLRAEMDGHCREYDGAEAFNDELTGKAMVIKEVNTIKELLMESEQSEINIIESLEKLESLRINVEALKATEIGRQVNNLRKHSSKEVRTIVRRLVRSWKDLVDEWVMSARDLTGNTRGGDDEEGLMSLSQDENVQLSVKTTPIELPQSRNCIDDEPTGSRGSHYQDVSPLVLRHLESKSLQTDHSGFHLKTNMTCYNNREVPEERGSSSRVEFSGSNRIERKLQSNCTEANNQIFKDQREMDHLGRWSVTKNSAGGSGPGRPVLDAPHRKSGPISRKFCSEDVKGKKNIGILGDTTQKKGDLVSSVFQKCTTDDKVQVAERLEVSKRKLQEGYQQAENAKKQRTVQVVDFPDLPKGGPARAKMPLQGHSMGASQNCYFNQSKSRFS